MRILQVVTYISPDGAYGGPVRVALNQAKALRDLGHDVVVVASAGGFNGSLPQKFDGYPVHLFPSRRILPHAGFAGMTSPQLLTWLTKALRGADVVHVHMARDLVTLPAAALTLLARKPLVLQTHGMIDQSNRRLARPLDALLTRPIMRQASAVLYLTDRESQDLRQVARQDLRTVQLANGVTIVANETSDEPKNNGNHEPRVPEVLYLARLHKRKRPRLFVQAAINLLSGDVRASFRLVGPDEGQAQDVEREINSSPVKSSIVYEGPLAPDATQERLAKSDIYVLPSIDEPFPMSAIEAMAAGKPIIVTKSCGLAPYVQNAGCGIVVDESLDSLTQAIRLLLDDEDLRRTMGRRAKELVRQELNIESVARKLSNVYKKSMKAHANTVRILASTHG